MEKVSISLSFEDEKIEAMEVFLHKEGSSVQKKMDEALRQLYEASVPEDVRVFLDIKSGKTKRAAAPRHETEPKEVTDEQQGDDAVGGQTLV